MNRERKMERTGRGRLHGPREREMEGTGKKKIE
jgi:hypothetical protein